MQVLSNCEYESSAIGQLATWTTCALGLVKRVTDNLNKMYETSSAIVDRAVPCDRAYDKSCQLAPLREHVQSIALAMDDFLNSAHIPHYSYVPQNDTLEITCEGLVEEIQALAPPEDFITCVVQFCATQRESNELWQNNHHVVSALLFLVNSVSFYQSICHALRSTTTLLSQLERPGCSDCLCVSCPRGSLLSAVAGALPAYKRLQNTLSTTVIELARQHAALLQNDLYCDTTLTTEYALSTTDGRWLAVSPDDPTFTLFAIDEDERIYLPVPAKPVWNPRTNQYERKRARNILVKIGRDAERGPIIVEPEEFRGMAIPQRLTLSFDVLYRYTNALLNQSYTASTHAAESFLPHSPHKKNKETNASAQ